MPSYASKPKTPAKSVSKYSPQVGADPNKFQGGGVSYYHVKKEDPKVVVTKAG